MDENKQDNSGNSPVAAPRTDKPFYKRVWFVIVAIILGLFIGLWLISFVIGLLLGGSSTSSSPEAERFYKMVETAAQKAKVRYGYETKKGELGTEDGLYVRSLTEYDAKTKQYSTAFVSESSIRPSAGRCVKGKEFKLTEGSMLFDTFAEAEEAMKAEWKESTRPTGTCDFTKTRYQGSFTDGLLPVGITADQAKKMATALKGHGGLAFKDEGTATYEGKKGKKISFEISKEKTGTDHRANLFFFAFRDGPSNDVGANYSDIDNIRNNFETRLNVTTPVPELKGYYIIDEKTNLPIFSEITTTAGGLPNFVPSTQLSVYEFPETFIIDSHTPVINVGKPQ